jgi:molybdate transport system substrate-binding protein
VAAVAANFGGPFKRIVEAFRKHTGAEVAVSTGSTGSLYNQIVQGAPFDVLLAADAARPKLLEDSGKAVKGSRFTYAVGRLALYGKALPDGRQGERVLREAKVRNFAIANPRTAPYGVAATQVLQKFGVHERTNLVRAENVTQTFQFVETGSAELGLVALSSLAGKPESSYWLVPESLHEPVLQDAVLLLRGARREEPRALLSFLRSAEARRIIETAGYRVP